MSRTLTTHVSLWDEAGKVVILAPGDELPAWAEGRVGPHCLMPTLETAEDDGESDAADGTSEREPDTAGDAEPKKSSAAAPDFTSAAPRRGRPRK